MTSSALAAAPWYVGPGQNASARPLVQNVLWIVTQSPQGIRPRRSLLSAGPVWLHRCACARGWEGCRVVSGWKAWGSTAGSWLMEVGGCLLFLPPWLCFGEATRLVGHERPSGVGMTHTSEEISEKRRWEKLGESLKGLLVTAGGKKTPEQKTVLS